MRSYLRPLLMMAALVALSGCQVVDYAAKHVDQSRIITHTGTNAFIARASTEQGKAERAATFIDAVDKLSALAHGGDEVTVDLLKSAVSDYLDKLPALSIADRQLVTDLVDSLVALLRQEVGAGVIAKDQLYKLDVFLGWVRETAILYVKAGS